MAHLIYLKSISFANQNQNLPQMYVHLRPICTFEADFLSENQPQMYSCLIGSDRSHEKIN